MSRFWDIWFFWKSSWAKWFLTAAAAAAGLTAANKSDSMIGFALLKHFHDFQSKRTSEGQFLGGLGLLKETWRGMTDRRRKKPSPFQNSGDFCPQNFTVNQGWTYQKNLKIQILIFHHCKFVYSVRFVFIHTSYIDSIMLTFHEATIWMKEMACEVC